MHTPAEEIGLASGRVGARLRAALLALAPERLRETLQASREDARRAMLLYLHEGHPTEVRILPAPLTLLPEQLRYLHVVALTLHEATRRMLPLWLADANVRSALPVSHGEEGWIRSCWGPAHVRLNPVFGRLDAAVLLESPQWKSSLQFLEPNLTGVGGLHMLPSAERILEERLGPVLAEVDPGLRLTPGQDIRDLLAGQLLEHLEGLGRPGRRICLIEARWADSGPEEQTLLAEHLHRRFGIEVCHADPAELVLDGDEVLLRGEVVDLGYRDYSVEELRELERRGVDVAPMRVLLAQNRMVSSIAAELEQKSMWEVFTDPMLADRHFTPGEREVFRRHVPWTRLLRARRTQLADGAVGDLPEYVRAERELLVLKPNRAYGGVGVCIGSQQDQRAWEWALDRAMAEPDTWVVQQRVSLPVHAFPVLAPDGGVRLQPLHVVLGIAATEEGLSVTGRASEDRVVNVARGGGIAVVMTAHPDSLDSGGGLGRDSPAS
ncbi:MAG: hypothetical protein EHM78_19560 [Myxococcaceae bacterium]|nr:MAG: hypothetical protein EHM78_19560 [Myxococcaceae bacterium]